jgi:hypothetical protein
MNNPDHISESSETIFWVKILKFFEARIRDPGWKNSDPGWKNSDPGWKKFGSGLGVLMTWADASGEERRKCQFLFYLFFHFIKASNYKA